MLRKIKILIYSLVIVTLVNSCTTRRQSYLKHARVSKNYIQPQDSNQKDLYASEEDGFNALNKDLFIEISDETQNESLKINITYLKEIDVNTSMISDRNHVTRISHHVNKAIPFAGIGGYLEHEKIDDVEFGQRNNPNQNKKPKKKKKQKISY